ncbi:unnamed protein product [Rodentolepis nana]|uniref:RRM domain-containing protein n=1 Tax=Rodentolepis nana TaxID=102285 RepID=A0A158QHF2_RODNA|nr:unnamed protein product [Rodentolepis nana]
MDKPVLFPITETEKQEFSVAPISTVDREKCIQVFIPVNSLVSVKRLKEKYEQFTKVEVVPQDPKSGIKYIVYVQVHQSALVACAAQEEKVVPKMEPIPPHSIVGVIIPRIISTRVAGPEPPPQQPSAPPIRRSIPLTQGGKTGQISATVQPGERTIWQDPAVIGVSDPTLAQYHQALQQQQYAQVQYQQALQQQQYAQPTHATHQPNKVTGAAPCPAREQAPPPEPLMVKTQLVPQTPSPPRSTISSSSFQIDHDRCCIFTIQNEDLEGLHYRLFFDYFKDYGFVECVVCLEKGADGFVQFYHPQQARKALKHPQHKFGETSLNLYPSDPKFFKDSSGELLGGNPFDQSNNHQKAGKRQLWFEEEEVEERGPSVDDLLRVIFVSQIQASTKGLEGKFHNTVGLKKPGQPPVNQSFHRFTPKNIAGLKEPGDQVCLLYEVGLPDFVEKRHYGFLGFDPILIRNSA